MGFEMMINALLKAMGYTKEDLENFIAQAKAEYDKLKNRAASTEQRVNELAEGQRRILQSLERIENALQSNPAKSGDHPVDNG